MANVAMTSGQTVLAAVSTSWTSACSNGGTVQFNWTDMNGDGLRGVGDTVTVQYRDCAVAQADSLLTGIVQMSITAKTDKTLGMTVDYGSGLLLVDQDGPTPSHLLGTMAVSWSDDGMTRLLTVASTARDDLRLTATFQDGNQVRQEVAQTKLMDLRKTLSREHARATTNLNFQLQSLYLGGTVTVSTPVPWSSYFDTYPDSGELDVRSTGAAVAKLKANYVSNSHQLSYEFDSNGDGVADDEGYAFWNQVTTGVMWWGEDFGGQHQFSKGNTKVFLATDFFVLSAPDQPGAAGQLPVVTLQFSHELAVESMPRLQLLRYDYDYGDPYFWGPAVVPVSAEVKGAYVVLTPSQPLQHGLTYMLQAVDAKGQALSTIAYKDTLGNTINEGGRSFTIDNSLSAAITLPSDAPLLSTGKSVTLSATTSRSTNGIVSYRWTQAEGVGVVFSDPDKATTTVSLADTSANNTSATVQLQITDASGQVEYSRKVISVIADPTSSSILYFRSQSGDYIGQGKQQVVLAPNGMFADAFASRPSYLHYFTNTQDSWTLDLAGDDGRPIHVGAYENATRAPFSAPGNGVDFGGAGRGCNTITGRFDVLDIAYDNNGKVTRLAVDFEQHCEGMVPALLGSLRYKSALPVRP